MTDNALENAVARSARVWRRAGVCPDDIREMTDELTGELYAAEADGYSVDSVLGPDPERGAIEWARERDLTGRAARYGSTTAGALTPIVVALLIAFAVSTSRFGGGVVLVGGYAVSIVLAYVGALLVARRMLRRGEDRAMSRSLHGLALGLPIAGVTAALFGVGTAAILGYTWQVSTVVAVLLVVVAVFAAALVTVRGIAVRRITIRS